MGKGDPAVVVAGAGGFIGGHLVRALRDLGYHVRAVDRKPSDHWFQLSAGVEVMQCDLADPASASAAVKNAHCVYNLAADMGGMGFIESNKARCMVSVLGSTNLLLAAAAVPVERFFYASSACVYPVSKQRNTEGIPLREEDAYPAEPEDGYGWEKLFSERMCRHFFEDFSLETRVARLHNVYGPWGTYCGGREKAPAALCRKVIEAKISGSNRIEIWGDGNQTRSFLYIDDCIKGILAITGSRLRSPVNLGSAELITINQLVDIIEDIAGTHLRRTYSTLAPQGVRGRSSDNSRFRAEFGWEPSVPIRVGLKATYDWIYREMAFHPRQGESCSGQERATRGGGP